MEPVFIRLSSGELKIGDTHAAASVKSPSSGRRSLPPQKVQENAVKEVKRLGGDSNCGRSVLGQYQVQFGKYAGHSFSWMLTNCLGYSAYIAESVSRETAVETNLSYNKQSFLEYMRLYPEGIEAISMKAAERQKRLKKPQQGLASASTVTSAATSTSERKETSSRANSSGNG